MPKRGSKLVGKTRAARTSMENLENSITHRHRHTCNHWRVLLRHALAPSKSYINHQETRFQLETKIPSRKKMDAMSQTCTKIITNQSPRGHETLATIKATPHTKLSLNAGKERRFATARCVASGSGYAAAMEPITPEEEEELTQRRGMCGGEANGGVSELLECLEKEAIMGDDDGRDPKDYSRRAKIFDKSSKIFKNIKEQRDHSPE
ncbi:hypothetical protein N665_0856s0018 [Sinapis alba]|nr:hypothetical protein N665_0856s0018 [Sinapis alba]